MKKKSPTTIADSIQNCLVKHGIPHSPLIVTELCRAAGVNLLTARHRAVLRLAMAGLSNDSIATELNITCSAVQKHVTEIYDRTGVVCRMQLGGLLALSVG